MAKEKIKVKDYISHSGLQEIKRILMGKAPFWGNELFLKIGREVHSLWLENKSTGEKFTKEEIKLINSMVKSLHESKVAMSIHKGAKYEHRFEPMRKLNGVKFKVILDIYKSIVGGDLKTTSAKSEEDFLNSCIKFDYFSQGHRYVVVAGLKRFYFIAVQKFAPFEVFILDLNKYPQHLKVAQEETKFLTYYFKTYGIPDEDKKYLQRAA